MKFRKQLKLAIVSTILIVTIFSVTSCGFTPNLFKNELSAEDIYKKVSPSVVEIKAESSTFSSTGTGFFYDNKGTVVTNYHVIEDCTSATITLASGKTYSVDKVLGYSKNRDLAVLSTDCSVSVPLNFRTTEVSTGETVYAIGSSLGLSGSLSNGIVSAAERSIDGETYIQTTAPISQGNSGGPLIDKNGYVIGITSASFSDGQNLNLAIPIAEIDNISLNRSISLEALFPQAKQEVEWLSDYFFQYYADDNSYVLLFQLSDKEEVPMSANGTVKIRIVNDDSVTVYNKTHSFSVANFEEWIYDDTDEMYLATIYISPQSIEKGSTEYGTVFFEVYGTDYSFEECTISVSDLPTSSNSGSNDSQQEGNTTTPPAQPEQYTCLDSNCKNIVDKNGEYCSKHKCASPNCSRKKDPSDNYCSSCSCYESGCKNAKQGSGLYCATHTCNSKNCTSKKERNSNYCSSHECYEISCHNEKYSTSGSYLYCKEHTCESDGCSSKKDASSNFCNYHECDAVGCKKEKKGYGSYCIDHTCGKYGCSSQTSTQSKFCSYHECYVPGCHNGQDGYGLYCAEHICSKSGCSSQKSADAKFCSLHECSYISCHNETRDSGSFFCAEHSCRYSGCVNSRLENSGYCDFHNQYN